MNQTSSTHSLLGFWQQGDWVSHSVLVLLFIMSIYSWWIIALGFRQARRTSLDTRGLERFWHSANIEAGVNLLRSHSPFRDLVGTAQEAVSHHKQTQQQTQNHQAQLHDKLDASDWLTRCLHNALDDAQAKLSRGLSVLASIGSTAPFIGLFGTVWGIYHALITMGQSQNLGISEVAGPVGEALIMTALGLAVAVPAVLGYNTLLRQQKTAMHAMRRFAHDLHAFFITGQRLGQVPNKAQE